MAIQGSTWTYEAATDLCGTEMVASPLRKETTMLALGMYEQCRCCYPLCTTGTSRDMARTTRRVERPCLKGPKHAPVSKDHATKQEMRSIDRRQHQQAQLDCLLGVGRHRAI